MSVPNFITPNLIKGSTFTVVLALVSTYVGIRIDLTQTRDEVESVNQKLTYIIQTLEQERQTDRENFQRQIDELNRHRGDLSLAHKP